MPEGTPLPPASEPTPVAPAAEPILDARAGSTSLLTSTGLAPNISAALSIFFLLVGGIVFLVVEKKDPLTRFWAMQSVLLGAVWFIVRLAFGFVGALLLHIFTPLFWLWAMVGFLVNLCFLAIWIVSIVQAFSGKRRDVPVLGPIARQQLARLGSRP